MTTATDITQPHLSGLTHIDALVSANGPGWNFLTPTPLKRRGGTVTREAGPMKHGGTVIAFVEDPDGYKIELIQKKSR